MWEVMGRPGTCGQESEFCCFRLLIESSRADRITRTPSGLCFPGERGSSGAAETRPRLVLTRRFQAQTSASASAFKTCLKLQLFVFSHKSRRPPTPPPHITHQHPHDVAPKLGEAVGQCRVGRPRLVGRRSGASISFHPATSRRFLPGKSAAKAGSKPREQQWTRRRCQGCCCSAKLPWTQRGGAPTSLGLVPS